jgi:hypothetical protein
MKVLRGHIEAAEPSQLGQPCPWVVLAIVRIGKHNVEHVVGDAVWSEVVLDGTAA